MPRVADTATVIPQPHRRRPDLTRLTPAELAELTAMVERLRRAGGFSPAHIRRVFDPTEERRLIDLERLVRWVPCDPATGPERPAPVMEHAKGVAVLMPARVVQSRRRNATSDLVDAVERISLVLDCPMARTIEPRADPDCVHRLEVCAAQLTTIANRLEQSQPAMMQIGA